MSKTKQMTAEELARLRQYDWGGAFEGAAVGAVGGAAAGTAVEPGLGTIIGAVAGAGLGFYTGWTAEDAEIEIETKQKALLRDQQAEQKFWADPDAKTMGNWHAPMMATGGQIPGAPVHSVENYSGAKHTSPSGGIPVDGKGRPSAVSGQQPQATVEGDEVLWNGYVFSDKLKGKDKKTFASQATKIMKKYHKRLGENLEHDDEMASEAMGKELNALANENEKARLTKLGVNEFANGGEITANHYKLAETKRILAEGGELDGGGNELEKLWGEIYNTADEDAAKARATEEFMGKNPDFIPQPGTVPMMKLGGPTETGDGMNMGGNYMGLATQLAGSYAQHSAYMDQLSSQKFSTEISEQQLRSAQEAEKIKQGLGHWPTKGYAEGGYLKQTTDLPWDMLLQENQKDLKTSRIPTPTMKQMNPKSIDSVYGFNAEDDPMQPRLATTPEGGHTVTETNKVPFKYDRDYTAYLPAVANIGRGIFGKAEHIDASDYMLDPNVRARTMRTDEAERAARANTYNKLRAYNPNSPTARQAQITANNVIEQAEIAKIKERAFNVNEQLRAQADAQSRQIEQKNLRTRMSVDEQNRMNQAAKEGLVTTGLGQMTEIYGAQEKDKNTQRMIDAMYPTYEDTIRHVGGTTRNEPFPPSTVDPALDSFIGSPAAGNVVPTAPVSTETTQESIDQYYPDQMMNDNLDAAIKTGQIKDPVVTQKDIKQWRKANPNYKDYDDLAVRSMIIGKQNMADVQPGGGVGEPTGDVTDAKIKQWREDNPKFASYDDQAVVSMIVGKQNMADVQPVGGEDPIIIEGGRASTKSRKETTLPEVEIIAKASDLDKWRGQNPEFRDYDDAAVKSMIEGNVDMSTINSAGGVGEPTEIGFSQIDKNIMQSEGFRDTIYKDSEGFDTVGYGHRLTEEDIASGRFNDGVSEDQAQALFIEDRKRTNELFYKQAEWAVKADPIVKEVLEDMAFNLGVQGTLDFTETLTAIKNKEFKKAADGIKDSLYYKQVPNRAQANIDKLLSLVKS